MSTVKHRPSGGLAAAAVGLLGHEPADRLLDQPVELGGADLVRDVGDVEVDVRGRLHRQDHGLAGHPAGPPRGQVPLDHPGPDAAEPVPELDGLAEVGLAGLGGQPDRGGELGDRELRDQRGAGSGDREAGLAVVPHGGRLIEGVDRVHARPGHRRLQLLGFRTVGRGGPGPGELEHRGGGVEVGGGAPCHDLIPAPTTDSQAPKTGLSTGVRRNFFGDFFEPPVRAAPRVRPPRGPRRSTPADRPWSRQARPPRAAWSRQARPPMGGVVSTGSTTEGRRGLDGLDHRWAAWSRQARPPMGGVVSTGSTTEGRRGLDRLDHRGRRGLDRLDHRRAAWSRQARPPRSGVVSTGSTTDERRGLDRLDHRRARWSRRVRRRPDRRPDLAGRGRPAVRRAAGPRARGRRCAGGGSWRGCEARVSRPPGKPASGAPFGASSTCAA